MSRKTIIAVLILTVLLGAAIPLIGQRSTFTERQQPISNFPGVSASPAVPSGKTQSPVALTETRVPSRPAMTASTGRPPAGATAVSGDSKPSLTPTPPFRTVFDERFAENQRGWPDNPQTTAWFEEGAYRLFARQTGHFVAIGAPVGDQLGDVVVIGTFRKLRGPPGGGYGLIVRDQQPAARDGIGQRGDFYVFEVGDRGEVGVWRREGDRWIDLLPWTASTAVRPEGAANQLTVQAKGQQLTFVVNGTQVASLMDPALPKGGVGVFVGGDLNVVALERFVLQVPG